jgi:hypothetical protein
MYHLRNVLFAIPIDGFAAIALEGLWKIPHGVTYSRT